MYFCSSGRLEGCVEGGRAAVERWAAPGTRNRERDRECGVSSKGSRARKRKYKKRKKWD